MTTLYKFRVRSPPKMKWRTANYRMTMEHARVSYGEGNYELIEGTEFTPQDYGPTSGFLGGKRGAAG